MKTNENLVIIGFMGVGKGNIARALSKSLKKFCLDCDDLIQSSQNLKIKEIFEKFGEAEFRKIEQNLAKFLQKNVKNSIISTGGGFYKVKNIKKIGKIIYLKSSFENIINRIENSPNSQKKFAKRPLLSDLQKAKELFCIRQKEYEKIADLIINVENKTTKKIISEIKKGIK